MSKERNRKYAVVRKMKRRLKEIAKELGFEALHITHLRPEEDMLVYYVSIYKNGVFVDLLDSGYFPEDKHSREEMILEFTRQLKDIHEE